MLAHVCECIPLNLHSRCSFGESIRLMMEKMVVTSKRLPKARYLSCARECVQVCAAEPAPTLQAGRVFQIRVDGGSDQSV